jgi:WD40 repeat protein
MPSGTPLLAYVDLLLIILLQTTMPEAGLDLSIVELANFMERHELPLSSCALQVYIAGPLFASSSTSIARGSLLLPHIRRVVPQLATTTFHPITFDAGARTFCVAVSPDGLMIAAGAEDHMIHLWDTKTRAYRVLRGHTDSVCTIAFSPNGRQLASGSKDAIVRVWNPTSGTEIGKRYGHRFAVLSVAFTRDGTRILSGSLDQDVIIWAGSRMYRLQDHSGPVTAVAVSPNSLLFATSSTDRTIYLRSTATSIIIRPLREHQDEVYCIAFSPDSSKLLSGGSAGIIHLWDIKTFCSHRIFTEHTQAINSLSWMPHSLHFLSASEDRTIRRWDANTGEVLAVVQGSSHSITDIDVFPDGEHFVASSRSGRVYIFNRGVRTLADQRKSGINAIKFLSCSPDGVLVAACDPDAVLHIWGVHTGEAVGIFEGAGSYPTSLKFSPNSSRIVMTYGDGSQDTWVVGYDFPRPASPPSSAAEVAVTFSGDSDGWVYFTRPSDMAPARYCWIPQDRRWTYWSSQVAWANGVLAIGTDDGVITILDFKSVWDPLS